MRVLHYVDENNLSWCEAWISLILRLSSLGVENCAVCRAGGTLSDKLTREKIPVFNYKPPIQALPFLSVGFSSLIDRVKPDVIHTRLSSAALTGGFWGKKKNIPVVSTVDKHAKAKYYGYSDIILPCSQAVAHFMAAQGVPNGKMEVVYNPIDTDKYEDKDNAREVMRKLHRIDENTKVIVSAGRFDDGKGFETLISAYAQFLKRGAAKPDTQLWLLGDGPMRTKYETLVNEFDISDYVTFHGYVSDIQRYFWASDLFVMPSEKPEGFGIVLLEAMASSLASAATNIGGATEIIIDESCGILCPPKSPEKMADMLSEVICDEKKLNKLANGARARACSDIFNINAIARQTANIYRSVCKDCK